MGLHALGERGLILTDDPAGTGSFWVRGRSAAWFPDSRRIVFQAEGDLWSIAIGDDPPVRLTETSDDERAARVAPDGQTIETLRSSKTVDAGAT
ncbi:MAG: hypothetical protein IIA44_09615, partial [Acidobacteria bacterium]|nr:hypothetical protein [Acidobacteriota bacterium]